MERFEKTILARNGKEFFLNWQQTLEKERASLEASGFLIKGVVGSGGRGIVLLIEKENKEQLAAKIFVYQDELIPQRDALLIWSGFTPNIIDTFSKKTLILEYIKTKTQPLIKLEGGLDLIKKIIKSSPKNRPPSSEFLNDYFSIRMFRANERNKIHHLYSKEEISKIEKIFFQLKQSSNPVVVHGDFSPGNILISQDNNNLIIDPRSFLWGDVSVDISKWILTYKRGASIQQGIDFFKNKDLLKPSVIPWLLIQAYDDSSAFASFPIADERIDRYQSIVQDILS